MKLPSRFVHGTPLGPRTFVLHHEDGSRVVASLDDEDRLWVDHERPGQATTRSIALPASRSRPVDGQASGDVLAPTGGVVRAVHAAIGRSVLAGEVLVVVEAMKMQLELKAPFDGQVAEIRATEESRVERGALLVRVMPLKS